MAWIINNPVNLQGNAAVNQEDCTYCFWHRWGPGAPYSLISSGCTGPKCGGCAYPSDAAATGNYFISGCVTNNGNPVVPAGLGGKCRGCWWEWQGENGYVGVFPEAPGVLAVNFSCPEDLCSPCEHPPSTEWSENQIRFVFTDCGTGSTTTTISPYEPKIPKEECRGCEWMAVDNGDNTYSFFITYEDCRYTNTNNSPAFCEPSCSGCADPVTFYSSDPIALNNYINVNIIYGNPIPTGCTLPEDPFDPVVPTPNPNCGGTCTCVWVVNSGSDPYSPLGPSYIGHWECTSSCDPGCQCNNPSIKDCYGRFFGDITIITCIGFTTTTTTPAPTTSTTTTYDPNCTYCVWAWYFGYWAEKVYDGCDNINCSCESPPLPYNPDIIYNPYLDLPTNPPPNGTLGYSNCVPSTTSTTTSTTYTYTTTNTTTTAAPATTTTTTTIAPPGTTTTTAAPGATTTAVPCGTCDWVWAAPGAWTQTGYCENLACSCSQPGYSGSTYGESSVTMCS